MGVIGTCINCPVNMGDQIGSVVWYSSGIIFGYFFNCGLCLVQVECVTFYSVLAHLKAVNYHLQVIQLEPLEVWHHRGIGVGSGV